MSQSEEEKPKRKIGRPKKEIDWDMVEALARIQCTGPEIAAVLNIPHSTLTGREEFSERYEKGRENGKASLRRMQFNLAKKNAALAIWLGKQWLGQKEPERVTDIIESDIKKAVQSAISEMDKGL